MPDPGSGSDSPSLRVCAVVLGSRDDSGEALVEAIATQTFPVYETVVQPSACVQGTAPWLWLVDDRTVPSATALEYLVAAFALTGLPEPALVASRIVDDRGRTHRGFLPWPERARHELAVAACEHHLMAIRAARRGSMLVPRRTVEQLGLPPGTASGDLEWTARVLRGRPGYLVPRSETVRKGTPSRAGASSPRASLRLLAGDSLTPSEKLLFGLSLLQDATGRSGSANAEPVSAPSLR